MKFGFNGFVAVAVLAIAGFARANDVPPVFTSGSATLTLSPNATSLLSAVHASFRAPAVIPSTLNLPKAGAINSASYTRFGAALTLNFSSMATHGDAVSSLHAANSFLDINVTRPEFVGPPTLLSVYLTDFDLNLGNSTVYANLYARNRTTNEMVAYGKLPIFRANLPGIAGGTQGHFVDDMDGNGVHASGSLAGELWMDPNTASIMLDRLDAPAASNAPIEMVWRNDSWGTLSFTASAVPESSVCALVGIGLLSLMMVRRAKPTTG